MYFLIDKANFLTLSKELENKSMSNVEQAIQRASENLETVVCKVLCTTVQTR